MRIQSLGHALAALVLGLTAACTVGDEADPSTTPPVPDDFDPLAHSNEPGREEPELLPYMPYVCNLDGLVAEGECSTGSVCGGDAYCNYFAWECWYWGHSYDMYAVIVDGTCGCHFHCDPYS